MATQTGKGRFGSDPQLGHAALRFTQNTIPRIAGLPCYGKTERRPPQRVTPSA
jgi:hypothetical protein